jgi:hypothetical protein
MGKRAKQATVDIGMRVKEPLRARIARTAKDRGVSMNAEMVDRLERSFSEERDRARLIEAIFGGPEILGLMKLISAAMQEAGQAAGFESAGSLEGAAGWMQNPYAYDQATKACLRILDTLKPPGPIEIPAETEKRGLADLGRGYANAIVAQMLGNETRTRFFTPERALEVRNDLGPVADRLSEKIIGREEDLLFTAHRDAKSQLIAKLTNRKPEG